MGIFVVAIYILCGFCLFKVSKSMDMVGRMRMRIEALEEDVEAAQEREEKISKELYEVKTGFSLHEIEQREDLHRLTVSLQKFENRLSDMEGELNDANEVMEAQARQEKALFDGINSIMDYDVTTARKAVNLDAEG